MKTVNQSRPCISGEADWSDPFGLGQSSSPPICVSRQKHVAFFTRQKVTLPSERETTVGPGNCCE